MAIIKTGSSSPLMLNLTPLSAQPGGALPGPAPQGAVSAPSDNGAAPGFSLLFQGSLQSQGARSLTSSEGNLLPQGGENLPEGHSPSGGEEGVPHSVADHQEVIPPLLSNSANRVSTPDASAEDTPDGMAGGATIPGEVSGSATAANDAARVVATDPAVQAAMASESDRKSPAARVDVEPVAPGRNVAASPVSPAGQASTSADPARPVTPVTPMTPSIQAAPASSATSSGTASGSAVQAVWTNQDQRGASDATPRAVVSTTSEQAITTKAPVAPVTPAVSSADGSAAPGGELAVAEDESRKGMESTQSADTKVAAAIRENVLVQVMPSATAVAGPAEQSAEPAPLQTAGVDTQANAQVGEPLTVVKNEQPDAVTAAPRRDTQPLSAATSTVLNGNGMGEVTDLTAGRDVGLPPGGRPEASVPRTGGEAAALKQDVGSAAIGAAMADAQGEDASESGQQSRQDGQGAAALAGSPGRGSASPQVGGQQPFSFADQLQQQMQQQLAEPRWGRQMGERAIMMAQHGPRSAQIQLDPPELGAMQIRIHVQGQDQVSVSFTSGNPLVRDALEQQLPRLREMFADQGLSLQDSSVSDDARQQGSGERERSADTAGNGGYAGDGDSHDVEVSRVAESALSLVDYYA